jgi:hypothetical protein
MPGYPIRTPWDPRSVDNSPRPIAASHVLHRLLVPRHPPFALTNLTTKMLASTVQFSNNTPPTTHTHHTPTRPPRPDRQFGGRWHRPETTTTPTTGEHTTPARTPPQQEIPHRGSGCSFRTQQDVFSTTPRPTNRLRSTPPPPITRGQGSTRNPAAHRRCDLPVSPPYEPQRRTVADGLGSATSSTGHWWTCSLERR